jgi:hypothetical protein
LDIGLTLVAYYFIIAFSFSLSTFITYILPSIKVAKLIAKEDENILGTNIVSFALEYVFWCVILFPIQFWQIMTTDPELYQERVVDVLLD